jgi:hypothetical protein
MWKCRTRLSPAPITSKFLFSTSRTEFLNFHFPVLQRCYHPSKSRIEENHKIAFYSKCLGPSSNLKLSRSAGVPEVVILLHERRVRISQTASLCRRLPVLRRESLTNMSSHNGEHDFGLLRHMLPSTAWYMYTQHLHWFGRFSPLLFRHP